MTTALTIAKVTLPMSIAAGFASVTEIQNFVTSDVLARMTKRQKIVVSYSYARAVYRAGLDLTIEQTALLAETTVEKVAHYMQKLKLPQTETISTNDATRIMCNMMEM